MTESTDEPPNQSTPPPAVEGAVNPYVSPIVDETPVGRSRPEPDGPIDASDINYPGGNWGLVGLGFGGRLIGVGLAVVGSNLRLPFLDGLFAAFVFLWPAVAALTLPGGWGWKATRGATAAFLTGAASLLYVPLCFVAFAVGVDGDHGKALLLVGLGVLAIESVSTVGVLWLVRRMARLRVSNRRRGEAQMEHLR